MVFIAAIENKQKKQMFGWEVGRNYINFALFYKGSFLASADGFDSLILTLGCLSDFWHFSSLQDDRGDKQRECQPLHSHHC